MEYKHFNEVGSGFKLLTGPAKPPGSGTGIPVRFGRKPIGTGRIQIWIQKTQFNRFDRFTGRFDRFEFKSKFKIACVTGLDRYTGLPAG